MADNEKEVYIDVLSDFGFKRIFGTEPHKVLLIAFLNEIFRGRKQIVDLVYNQNEYPGEHKETGTVIFDLLCKTDQGEHILIEVQKSRQENFFQRALYYGSRLITAQIPVGQRRQWSYHLSGVYVIALVEAFRLPIAFSETYLHQIQLCNVPQRNFVYEDFALIFIELLKFDRQEHELETELEKWLYVLKNMSKLKQLPLVLRKPVFEKLFDIAAYVNLSKEEKSMYDVSLKRKWDEANIRNTLIKDAKAEGRAEAAAEIAEAHAQVEQARVEAKQLKAVEIARKMKVNGIDLMEISELTGISFQEFSEL